MAWAARRALERVDRDAWQEQVLPPASRGCFSTLAVSLLALYPDEEAIDPVLGRASDLLNGYLNDDDFRDDAA